jgi:stress-induced morphogen
VLSVVSDSGAFLQGGCGSFYAISITSAAFKGLPIVKQHRLVNDALKAEIEGIHGLQVRLLIYARSFLFTDPLQLKTTAT